MNPLISIALSTYNGEKYIDEQINSLLNQTYRPLEIIICDDASTDSTGKLLEKFETNQNVKVLRNDINKGLTSNIQFILQQCSGEYIALSDQDDIWEPNKLELMFNEIADELLIYSDSRLINEEGADLHRKLSDLRNMHTGNNTLGFAFNNCVWGHAILLKRTLLKNILPIPLNVPHDSWIGFVAAAEKRICFLNIPLTLYRQHSSSVTSTLPKKYTSSKYLKQQDYLKRLDWLKALSEYPLNHYKKEYKQLYTLFNKKKEGSFVFPLFLFLLRKRNLVFEFSKKSNFSRFNEIRKLSRGIKISI